MKKPLLSIVGLSLLLSSSSFAAKPPQSFTYQGKIMNAAGTAPLSAVVSLKLDILDPTGNCLLYSETQSGIDLSQTNGLFSVQVGSGLADNPNKRSATDQSLTMAQVFANNGQILASSTPNCTSGYTPAAGEGRILRVTVTNGGSTTTITPDLKIGSVPNAIVAETIQGTDLKNILTSQTTSPSGEHVERLTVAVTCSASPCVIASQSSNWFSSVSRTNVGQYTVNINPGQFSSAPTCVVSSLNSNSGYNICTGLGTPSTTSFLLNCATANTAAGQDTDFNIICMGPK